MLNNVTLKESDLGGRVTWRLLGPDGQPIDAFSTFADTLVRKKHPLNTRQAYCRHLAEFLDYLIEAGNLLQAHGTDGPLTRGHLQEIIESYDDYLVFGDLAGSRIARLVHQRRPSPKNKAGSSAGKHAAIRKFLKLSEAIRHQMLELAKAGLSPALVDNRPLLSEQHREPIPHHQRQAMIGSSMIAGVVSGGPQLAEVVVLPTPAPGVQYDPSRAFPFDRIADFIAHLPTYRDKAFYSLLAASGGRTSEGLQLLFDDLDLTNGTVALRNPRSRPNHSSYLSLTPQQRELLSWKGRTIESTVLIEPFSSMFFSALQRYMEDEYVPHGRHQFVFQYLTNNHLLGEPYFLSASTTRLEIFRNAVEAAGIEEWVSGPHSLRHAYGTYALNYFPRIGGKYGLPLAVVQQLMGHASAKSTLKYAQYDEDLIRAELRHANALLFSQGTPKSLLQMKLEALTAQVRTVQNEMQALKGMLGAE